MPISPSPGLEQNHLRAGIARGRREPAHVVLHERRIGERHRALLLEYEDVPPFLSQSLEDRALAPMPLESHPVARRHPDFN